MSSIRYSEEEYTRLVTKGMTPKSPRVPAKVSELETMMAECIEAAGLPAPRRQFHPIDGRGFMLDFAWPEHKLGLECDGNVHRIKGRFKADQERRNLLTLAGWRVLTVNREHIVSGQAVEWLRLLLP